MSGILTSVGRFLYLQNTESEGGGVKHYFIPNSIVVIVRKSHNLSISFGA